MFAADVRHRAADDGCFLLPAGHSVKGPEDRGRTIEDSWKGVVTTQRRNFCPPSSVLRHLELAGVEEKHFPASSKAYIANRA